MAYIKKENIDFRLPYYVEESGDALLPLRAVQKVIAMTPEEDVIPRSDVTKLFDELGSCLDIVSCHPGLYTISEADLNRLKEKFGVLNNENNEKDS
jgi:hypothetical protein